MNPVFKTYRTRIGLRRLNFSLLRETRPTAATLLKVGTILKEAVTTLLVASGKINEARKPEKVQPSHQVAQV